jgi:hypothetical protein
MASARSDRNTHVARWARFEYMFASTVLYANPFQDVSLSVTFTSETGRIRTVEGFWNGGTEWRVRFMPDELGSWAFTSRCSDENNRGLHEQSGTFYCSEPRENNRFEWHGSVQLSPNRRYLVHADGTPFFWMADTAWNGPMRSTPDEWNAYLAERKRQGFTTVQWIATQWISAPDGDWTGELAFTGTDKILINPAFFARLDQKIVAMNREGLLSAAVMLWAALWSPPDVNARNPGYLLPEEQAVRLARYMLARWGAYHMAWFINGDGDYRGEYAERWKRIGRAVFSDPIHAPVSLHPGGRQWNLEEFQHEPWLDVIGYQSGHGDDDPSFEWIVNGPPFTDWIKEPIRPFINLELPYENHISYHSRKPHDDHSVRRATYWSLLVAPTAGVTYGGHGVWGWDDGTQPPIGHSGTGIPFHWRKALTMPAAEQIRHLTDFFSSFEWWKLQPAQHVLAAQPGDEVRARYITAAQSDEVVVIYLPQNDSVYLRADAFSPASSAEWFNPRTGERHAAELRVDSGMYRGEVPAPGDWILLIKRDKQRVK